MKERSEASSKRKGKLTSVVTEEHTVYEEFQIVVSSLWQGVISGKVIEGVVKHHTVSLHTSLAYTPL